MEIADVLSILLGSNGVQDIPASVNEASQINMAQMQDALNPFSLGTLEHKRNKKRHRKEIYTKWEMMLKFAPIAEAVGIHVNAALGGDSATSKQVFITPADRLRDKKLGSINKEQLQRLEKRIKPMEDLINQHIAKICHNAVGWGDAYTRVYGEKTKGVVDLLANEFTYPPLVQAYEQLNKTVAYHILDPKSWNKTISKLSGVQMLRAKMPRFVQVSQYHPTDMVYMAKTLQSDDPKDAPILTALVGGSLCAVVEEFFDNIIIILSGMNSQQIADAVNQMFFSVNMSAMPPAQRKSYIDGLQDIIFNHEKHIRNALENGDAIWNTKFHLLPTTNDKQVLNALGDLKGQRSSTSGNSIETLMINVRLLMGGLGLDPSMVGWADMLSGGLGDGAGTLTYSSQVMRRSIPTRQVLAKLINDILVLDWGYAYGEYFTNPEDYPWKIDFYSDQSAAMTEAIQNQQTRVNSTIGLSQAMASIKDLGLTEENVIRILETRCGLDYEDAVRFAKDLAKSEETEQEVSV